jgi:hypothetical protein
VRLELELSDVEIEVVLDALMTVAGIMEHRLDDTMGAFLLWEVVSKIRRATEEEP